MTTPPDPTNSAADAPEPEPELWPPVPVLEPHHFVTEPMESERHLLAMILLLELVREALKPRQDVFIGGDMVVYFSDLQVKNKDFRAPDVFVVLGVDPHERDGWIVWREGGKYPDLVIELMSRTSKSTDLGPKVATYGNIWQVKEYLAFDPDDGALHAFKRGDNGLVRNPAERTDGRVRSEVLGAWFGTSDAPFNTRPGPWLRLFRDDGSPIPTLAEQVRSEAERAQLQAERAQLQAERAQLQAERAQLEAERAQLESARADHAEARAAALEAELAALRASRS